MKWLSKLALFALGLGLLVLRPVGAVAVAALLAALIAACLCATFSQRWVTALVAALWLVAVFFFPCFAFFWPLLLYDILARRLWPLLAVCAAGLLAAWPIYTPADLALLAFALGLAVLLWQYQRRLDALEQQARTIRDTTHEINLALQQKNEALQQAQDANVKLATLSERGRIAREIHDNVGHLLARSMMQVGAVMTVNQEPAVAEGLEQLKDTLTLAMNSVRESVHDLRDDAIDLYDTVTRSLQDFTAYETNFNYDMGHDAPTPVKACFAAVVGEALANIARHSSATRIHISLQEHPQFYQLAVADNGATTTPPNSAGMGLENMRLRAAALGGRFTVRRENGFAIHISVPKTTQI